MALITCPECGNQVSDLAPMCPNCGYPIPLIKKDKMGNMAARTDVAKSKYNYVQCQPSDYENKRKKFKYSGRASAIIIPDEVTTITDKSFKKISAVLLGKNVETVHRVHVEWFDVSDDNPFYSSIDGILFNKDKTEIVRYPTLRKETEFVVPVSVKRIRKEAFYGAKYLESVVLHDGLLIEEASFYQANKLSKIRWAGNSYPDNSWPPAVQMYDDVFCNCGITSIVFLDGITEIRRAFSGCPIESVIIPDSVRYLALGQLKQLKEITIPDSVETLGDSAFRNCVELRSIIIPDSVKEIGVWCFDSCKSLISAKLPLELEQIPDSCFHYCENLNSLAMPNKVKAIGTYAFSGCSKLTTINLPEGLEFIAESAFAHTGIKRISVPDSVVEFSSIFEDIKEVSISESAIKNMSTADRERKEKVDRRKAEDAALMASIQKTIDNIDKEISELSDALEKGEFFAFQKNAKRIAKKREDNKARLNAMLASRNYAEYNKLLLDINEINQRPIFYYNACGRLIKLYNRNGIDCTFAVEIDGLVYTINPLQDEMRNIVIQSATDASQLDKAIMTAIAAGPLLGYVATSLAQIYNYIDVSFSLVNKITGRNVRVVFGDKYRVRSDEYLGIMTKIQDFFRLITDLCDNVPPYELAAANYIER